MHQVTNMVASLLTRQTNESGTQEIWMKLINIVLLTHASTCASLSNLQTHSIFLEPLPQMRGQRECTYYMYAVNVWCIVCDQSSVMCNWHRYPNSEAFLQFKASTVTSMQFDLSTYCNLRHQMEAIENLCELSQSALKQTRWYAGMCWTVSFGLIWFCSGCR